MRPDPKPAKPVKLTGKKKTEFRRVVAKRAGEKCEVCGVHAPSLIYGVFDVFNCGHVCHIRPRSIGGDVMPNVVWKCYYCHIIIEHGLRWGEKGA